MNFPHCEEQSDLTEFFCEFKIAFISHNFWPSLIFALMYIKTKGKVIWQNFSVNSNWLRQEHELLSFHIIFGWVKWFDVIFLKIQILLCFHITFFLDKPLRLLHIHCRGRSLCKRSSMVPDSKSKSSITLRTWSQVSSSWGDRLRISDRKFVNHTTEMILWSMILGWNWLYG